MEPTNFTLKTLCTALLACCLVNCVCGDNNGAVVAGADKSSPCTCLPPINSLLQSVEPLRSVVPRVINTGDGSVCAVDRTPGCYGAGKLRIGVVTLATRGAHPMTMFSTMIMAMYSHHHGYDLLIERCASSTRGNGTYLWEKAEPDTNREKRHQQAVWSKSLALLKHLPYYDFLMFVDSDTVFVGHKYAIEV
jgi:hypothetical protein